MRLIPLHADLLSCFAFTENPPPSRSPDDQRRYRKVYGEREQVLWVIPDPPPRDNPHVQWQLTLRGCDHRARRSRCRRCSGSSHRNRPLPRPRAARGTFAGPMRAGLCRMLKRFAKGSILLQSAHLSTLRPSASACQHVAGFAGRLVSISAICFGGGLPASHQDQSFRELVSGFAAGWASFHWRITREREVSNDGA